MDDLTDASRRGTGNLATPDNSRNCDAPDMGDLERAMPVERTSLPLAFTVITGIQPARLTKVIGLSADGSMRKESSAMLSRGRAQRVVAADLNDLRATLDALTSAQAPGEQPVISAYCNGANLALDPVVACRIVREMFNIGSVNSCAKMS